MAQGMEFRWMGQGPSEDEIARLEAAKNDAEELAQLQKANQNASRAVNWMELGEQLGTSGAYQEAMANQAAQEAQKQADMQRIQELQSKIAERKKAVMDDPRMQIAAMLAMGGQPSALSSMLVSSVQGDIQAKQKAADAKDRADKEMEALEKGLQNDLMYLASMNKDQRKKVLEVSLPMFRTKFKELEALGARSLMGGLGAWEKKFEGFLSVGKSKEDEANKKKNTTKNLLKRISGGN